MPKKGKKGKEKVSLEDFDTTPMSKEQLVKLCVRLQEETKREQAERNFFMMERDKLRAFWEVTRKQLDDARAELRKSGYPAYHAFRDKDHRLDDDDMARLSEIKFHEQKILFTMLEYQTSIAKMKIENMEVLNKAQQDIWADVVSLRLDNEDTAEEAAIMTAKQQWSIQDANMEHSAEVTRKRDEHVVTVVDVSGHFERQVTVVRAEASERHRLELAAMAELQRVQTELLLQSHALALTDLKNYYNEITLNNLSLVATLKDECGELREREDRAVQLARALRAENKMLAGPLREAREELAELGRQMQNFESDQIELERATAHAHAAEKELRDVKWEMDVMQILLDKVHEERLALEEELTKAQAELKLH
ncbi:Dynein regulatory complex subunit 4 [Gryllus bimaculatus]|nr:Dynein regulatory complex subunit 4 [Gryllus bimaculatus]